MELLHILIVVLVMQLKTFVKTWRTVHKKSEFYVNFILLAGEKQSWRINQNTKKKKKFQFTTVTSVNTIKTESASWVVLQF